MISSLFRATAALLFLGLLISAGCNRREEIRVYDAPKDPPSPIEWTVPAGWRETNPAPMQYASFIVSADHRDTAVTVTPLPFSAEQLVANVNRWEGQVGLPPTAPADINKVVKHLDGGKVPMGVVDLVGKDSKDGSPRRIIAAVAEKWGSGFFFKLSGPPETVEQQKTNFESFLRSVTFNGKGPPPAPAAASGSQASADPHEGHDHDDAEADPHAGSTSTSASSLAWDSLPAGWVVDPTPRQFRSYTFKVAGTGGEGELAITRMPQQTAGALVNNINMWRRDVGLPDVQDVSTTPQRKLDLKDRPGFAVDLAGPQKRLMVAVLGSGTDIWFFKLGGPIALVESQKGSFDSFVTSVRFVGESN